MKSWTVVICLMVSQLAELGCGKRFDPAMVDPLIRRSPLDKNFMRFGRSSPAYDDKEEADETPPGEDTFVRPMRGKENNFMRFGRGKNDNFMRFGRGKQDSFMRFGRARNDNFMRFGRGKQDNFMRFGRGKQDNFMRFGRGKQDNYMRFGRGKEDNYMRFGRGKQDSFMRFGKGVNYGKQDSFMRLGRGKNDNFMRFGRELVTSDNLSTGIFLEPPDADDAERVTRGRENNFMRFGKKSEEDPLNDFPFEVQSINPKQSLVRIVRGKQDNFMRFGKSDDDKSFAQDKEHDDKESKVKDDFQRPIDLEMIRYGRHPVRNNNAFIRYGRSSQPQEDPNEVIPQRLKRSILNYDSPDVPETLTLPEDLEEEYAIPIHPDEYNNRKKRSLVPLSSTPSPDQDSSVVDYISAKLRLQSSQPQFEPSLLSAGLPNVIVGPEFSLLPDIDPPASMLKRGRPGDKSFLRLG